MTLSVTQRGTRFGATEKPNGKVSTSLLHLRPPGKKEEHLANGQIITSAKRSVLLAAFADGFWNYDGDYITRRLARGGHFSRTFAVTRASQLERPILPAFGGRTLRSMTRSEIEAWQMKLYREGHHTSDDQPRSRQFEGDHEGGGP